MPTSDSVKIEAYFAKLPDDQRAALLHIRDVVRAAAPEAEEALVYGVPGFKQDGGLVCYAAFKAHCGFYPMSPAVLIAFKQALSGFKTAKGTIQFTPDAPIPDDVITAIVKRRIEENEIAASVRRVSRRAPTA